MAETPDDRTELQPPAEPAPVARKVPYALLAAAGVCVATACAALASFAVSSAGEAQPGEAQREVHKCMQNLPAPCVLESRPGP